MHYSKRFIAFGGIVAIAFLIKYNIPGAEYEQIGSFRGASLEAETWNPLIASSVNDNLLSVIIDNKQYTNEKYKFYMDDNLDIMMPVSILRDALNCSAHIYDGDRLVVEKHSSDISFSLDQETATPKTNRDFFASQAKTGLGSTKNCSFTNETSSSFWNMQSMTAVPSPR